MPAPAVRYKAQVSRRSHRMRRRISEIFTSIRQRFGKQSGFHQKYYEHNVIGDVEARRSWVPPPSWP